VTPRHPDTDGPIAGFAALPSDERMAEMIRSADLSMRDQWGRHRSRTSYYWRDMGHAVAVLLRNHLPLVEALRGLRLPAEPEAPTPANDCAGYGFGICPCGCHDQPVPTPEPPAEPDPCDGCGASRLSMRHYIGCPMASTHRWDPVVGTWVASNPRRDILDRLMELWQEPWSEPAFGEAQMLLARLRASRPVPTPEPPAEPHYNAIHEDGTNGSIDRPASVPEAAPGLRRWAESLLTHAERDGLVWVTKAEVRATLDATSPPALDAPRHPDDTPCEHLIPARECRIVGCRGASTDTPEAEG
jgi:hypothetical protein